MTNIHKRSALALTLLMALFSMSAGCTNLPFLRGVHAASPSPSGNETPASESEGDQVIEGHVGIGTPPVPMTATVHLANMAFSPNQITVGTGGTVTFINDDSMPHSVVPRSGAQFTGSETFGTGQQVTITFAQAGSQPYVCGLHSGMTGTVTVQTP